MKVCLIGIGSIAIRHISNLSELFGSEIIIDILRSGKGREIKTDILTLIHRIYYNFEELPDDYDVIFITNPTILHYETLKSVNAHAKHFFIEKPVFKTGEESIEELCLKNDSIYYVACPLRYTKVIQYLKKTIDFSKVYSMRCISSSYLPEWRPGTDYRNTYSARKELGGGVSIDLIHEWDYINYLVGWPDAVYHFAEKKSDLEIDSDDIAIYIAEYADKLVELHLDYFGREAIRKLELFSKEDTVEADLIDQKVIFKKQKKIINFAQDRDDYQKKELIHFFDILSGTVPNDNSIVEACRTLKIAGGKI